MAEDAKTSVQYVWKDAKGTPNSSDMPPKDGAVKYWIRKINSYGRVVSETLSTPRTRDDEQKAQDKKDAAADAKRNQGIWDQKCQHEVDLDQREIDAATNDLQESVSKLDDAKSTAAVDYANLKTVNSRFLKVRGYGQLVSVGIGGTIAAVGILYASPVIAFGAIPLGIGNELLAGGSGIDVAAAASLSSSGATNELLAEKAAHFIAKSSPEQLAQSGASAWEVAGAYKVAAKLLHFVGPGVDASSAIHMAHDFPDIIFPDDGDSSKKLSEFYEEAKRAKGNLSDLFSSAKKDQISATDKAISSAKDREKMEKEVASKKEKLKQVAKAVRERESQGVCVRSKIRAKIPEGY